MISNAISPPGKDWIFVSRRRLVAGNQVFHAGSQIPPEVLGRNVHAMLKSGFVVWLPPGTPIAAKPTTLPPPSPPKPRPEIEIVSTGKDDPVSDWLATVELMTGRRNGVTSDAMDLLMGNPAARDLYKLAARVGTAETARKKRRVSVSPTEIGL